MDSFTVVTWNMQQKQASWDALPRLGADVALLNEARIPGGGIEARTLGGRRTEGLDGYRRPWAAAIVSPHPLQEIDDARASRNGKAIPIPFGPSRPGSWVAARVTIPGFGEVTAVSLYGLMDEKSDASVHRSLSELSPLFEDPRYRDHLVLGGDLNTWTGWKAGSSHLDRDRIVLERIHAYGLVDLLDRVREPGRLDGCPCSLGDDCRHTRTRLDARHPGTPYQMDYLFGSEAVAERLTACSVPAEAPWPEPSDHYPIVATFRF
jgi:endonuclease/exonuclease/phosphatase family metal-dependent hydrolase